MALKTDASFETCVGAARAIFDEDYDHNIKDLLHLFPKDHADAETGVLFWSGPKRAPEPVEFDANDALCLDYAYATANLLAFNLGIP